MEEFAVKLTIVLVWVGASAGIGRLARRFQRSAPGWFFLSLLFSPVVSVVFLLVADVPLSAVKASEKDEDVRGRFPEATAGEIKEIAAHERTCPSCGAPVNTHTREGVLQKENEPWVLLCSGCEQALPEHFFH